MNMEFGNFIYVLLLVLFSVATAGVSLKRRDGFLSKLKYLFPAMLFSGAIFILWDIRFAELGIWNFNPEFFLGISIQKLPIEEWLFFFVIPFFSVYIYEILKERSMTFSRPNFFVVISLALLVVFAFMAYSYRRNLYTFFTFFLLSIYFGYTIFRNNFKKNYAVFYLSFLLALIPFLILRGVLVALPVMSFNGEHIMNVHIFSMPVEDLGYFFLLHLMNITIFEYLSVKQFY